MPAGKRAAVLRSLVSVLEDHHEELALLEARDLLFARLLQYRAYKEVSALFADRMAHAGRQVPRTPALGEPLGRARRQVKDQARHPQAQHHEGVQPRSL